VKPRIVVSRCLGFEACRWNGEIIRSEALGRLRDSVDFVTVCPETGIGLGTPRKPIDLRLIDGEIRVTQKETGRDMTDELEAFSEGFLDRLGDIDGFILKSRSPSCGLGTTKIHNDSGVSLGSGVFASRVERRYGGHVIIDEDELREMGAEAFLRLVSEP